MSLTDQLARFFRQHRRTWIDGRELARVAGAYGWRSRVSDCRRFLRMKIDNRVVYLTRGSQRWRKSEYRFSK